MSFSFTGNSDVTSGWRVGQVRRQPPGCSAGCLTCTRCLTPLRRSDNLRYSAAILALNLISLGTAGSFTTSTGACHLNVLMRHVPVLSSRQYTSVNDTRTTAPPSPTPNGTRSGSVSSFPVLLALTGGVPDASAPCFIEIEYRCGASGLR